ncbi:MAG: hypothetical protein KBT12_08505 [Bacteroidales bacterium]|nr:hypothetical protein [Candidatus Physcousia equi]
MGNMVIDEETGLLIIPRKQQTGKADQPKPKIKLVGRLESEEEKETTTGSMPSAPPRDTTPPPTMQESKGLAMGNGRFEMNADGYIVESEKGRKEREERTKNSPKAIIYGVDPEAIEEQRKARELEEAERRKRHEEIKKKYRGGRCYQTKDGFFIFETRPGQIEEIKRKEKEREKEEKKRKAEEKKKKRDEEKQRKAEERKKKKEAEAERKRKKKQDELNKRNGTYAGDGYHYEEMEFKLVGGGSMTTKVVVANDSPSPKIAF